MSPSLSQHVSTVLYIENNEDDVALFELALRGTQNITLLPFANPQTAENHLLQIEQLKSDPLPDLLFVDFQLNLGGTGLNFFSWERQHPEMPHIPTIVFSGDDFPDITAACYQNGADLFLLKPTSYLHWLKLGELLERCLLATPPEIDILRQEPFYRPP